MKDIGLPWTWDEQGPVEATVYRILDCRGRLVAKMRSETRDTKEASLSLTKVKAIVAQMNSLEGESR